MASGCGDIPKWILPALSALSLEKETLQEVDCETFNNYFLESYRAQSLSAFSSAALRRAALRLI